MMLTYTWSMSKRWGSFWRQSSIKSICGASYIDVTNRCIDISKDEPHTKCLICVFIKILGGKTISSAQKFCSLAA